MTDPWMHDGIYEGSWALAYRLPCSPKALRPDYVWISHVHPDHFDPATLRSLGSVPKKILVADFEPPTLQRALEEAGFSSFTLPSDRWTLIESGLEVIAIPFDTMDSVLLVRTVDGIVAFISDTALDQKTADRMLALAGGRVDLAYVQYAGAGPWPQCFEISSSDTMIAAKKKESQFLKRTQSYWQMLGSPAVVIYAGEYELQGPLAQKNEFRGVPSRAQAHERLRTDFGVNNLLAIGPGGTVELKGNAAAALDAGATRKPNRTTTDAAIKYDYFQRFSILDGDSFPIKTIVEACTETMLREFRRLSEPKQKSLSRWSIVLSFTDREEMFAIGFIDSAVASIHALEEVPKPRLQMKIPLSLFVSAALSISDWNTLEIGSHIQYRREPDKFSRTLQKLIHSFHV